MRCNIFSTCLTALCLLFAVQACAAASATSSASVTVGDGSVVVSAPIKSDIVLPYDLKYWVGIGGSYPIEGITQGLAATLTMPNASTQNAVFGTQVKKNIGFTGEAGIRNEHFGARVRYDYFKTTVSLTGSVNYQGNVIDLSATPTYYASDYFAQGMYFVPLFSKYSDVYAAAGMGLTNASIALDNSVTAIYAATGAPLSGVTSGAQTYTVNAITFPISLGVDIALSKCLAVNIDATYILMGFNNVFKINDADAGISIDSSFIPSASLKFRF